MSSRAFRAVLSWCLTDVGHGMRSEVGRTAGVAFPFEHELVAGWSATGGCTLSGWSGRYESDGQPVLKIDVTPQLFLAEFFPDELPEFMEPELHDIFSRLNGRHSREDAADMLCKMPYQSAQMACKKWSATAKLCPEVVDQVFDPWEKVPGWSAEGACSFNGWSGRYTAEGAPVLMADIGLSSTTIKLMTDPINSDMELLQELNGTHPNDVFREKFCKFRESAWDYLASDRACHLWSHHRLCHDHKEVLPFKEVADPWQHPLTLAWTAYDDNGCRGGHWVGRYNISTLPVLHVDVGPVTGTILVSQEALTSMDDEDKDLLQKINGTKFNDELSEILCDFRRSNPWNIETSDKACYLWSQIRCNPLCPQLDES